MPLRIARPRSSTSPPPPPCAGEELSFGLSPVSPQRRGRARRKGYEGPKLSYFDFFSGGGRPPAEQAGVRLFPDRDDRYRGWGAYNWRLRVAPNEKKRVRFRTHR